MVNDVSVSTTILCWLLFPYQFPLQFQIGSCISFCISHEPPFVFSDRFSSVLVQLCSVVFCFRWYDFTCTVDFSVTEQLLAQPYFSCCVFPICFTGNMGWSGISVVSVRKLLAKILYFSNVINVIRSSNLILCIGFSFDICKSDTSAL